MDSIKKEVDELFDELKETTTYKEYEEVVSKLHNNDKIMNLISEIKRLQKILVNNKDSVVEKELDMLIKELNSYPLYQAYLIKKEELEDELKEIKSMFETYFKEVLKID